MSSGPSEPIQTSAKGKRQDVGETEERINGEKVKRRRREQNRIALTTRIRRTC
jgi:hypothetical protein